jgi:hypothetical protein
MEKRRKTCSVLVSYPCITMILQSRNMHTHQILCIVSERNSIPSTVTPRFIYHRIPSYTNPSPPSSHPLHKKTLCQIQNLDPTLPPLPPFFTLQHRRCPLTRFLRTVYIHKIPSACDTLPQNNGAFLLLPRFPRRRRRSRG